MVKEVRGGLGRNLLVGMVLFASSLLGYGARKAESAEIYVNSVPIAQSVTGDPFKGTIAEGILGSTATEDTQEAGSINKGIIKSPEEDISISPLENKTSDIGIVQVPLEKKDRDYNWKFWIPFEDPITNFYANAYLTHSAFQGVEMLGYKLTDKYGDSLINRLGIGTLVWYLDSWVRIFGHEGGHIREGKRWGDALWDVEFNSWSPFGFGGNFPKHYHYVATDEQHIWREAAGLNQDRYNASTIVRNQGDISFADGMAYLIADFRDVTYNFDSRNRPGEGDVNQYFDLLERRGIKIDRETHLWWALGTSLASRDTWYSLQALVGYLETGQMSVKRFKIDLRGIGIDADMTWPKFGPYLTLNGILVNAETTVNRDSKNPVEINIGTGVTSGVDVLRIGAQYGNLIKDDRWSVSPFLYTNLYDPGQLSVGADLEFRITERASLGLRTEHNKDDIIKNGVMGLDKGFTLFVFGEYGF